MECSVNQRQRHLGSSGKLAQTQNEVSTLSMMLGPEQNGVSHQEKEPVGTIMCDGCSGPGRGCWAKAVFRRCEAVS